MVPSEPTIHGACAGPVELRSASARTVGAAVPGGLGALPPSRPGGRGPLHVPRRGRDRPRDHEALTRGVRGREHDGQALPGEAATGHRHAALLVEDEPRRLEAADARLARPGDGRQPDHLGDLAHHPARLQVDDPHRAREAVLVGGHDPVVAGPRRAAVGGDRGSPRAVPRGQDLARRPEQLHREALHVDREQSTVHAGEPGRAPHHAEDDPPHRLGGPQHHLGAHRAGVDVDELDPHPVPRPLREHQGASVLGQPERRVHHGLRRVGARFPAEGHGLAVDRDGEGPLDVLLDGRPLLLPARALLRGRLGRQLLGERPRLEEVPGPVEPADVGRALVLGDDPRRLRARRLRLGVLLVAEVAQQRRVQARERRGGVTGGQLPARREELRARARRALGGDLRVRLACNPPRLGHALQRGFVRGERVDGSLGIAPEVLPRDGDGQHGLHPGGRRRAAGRQVEPAAELGRARLADPPAQRRLQLCPGEETLARIGRGELRPHQLHLRGLALRLEGGLDLARPVLGGLVRQPPPLLGGPEDAPRRLALRPPREHLGRLLLGLAVVPGGGERCQLRLEGTARRGPQAGDLVCHAEDGRVRRVALAEVGEMGGRLLGVPRFERARRERGAGFGSLVLAGPPEQGDRLRRVARSRGRHREEGADVGVGDGCARERGLEGDGAGVVAQRLDQEREQRRRRPGRSAARRHGALEVGARALEVVRLDSVFRVLDQRLRGGVRGGRVFVLRRLRPASARARRGGRRRGLRGGRPQVELEPHPRSRVLVEGVEHGVATVPPVAAMEERDRALLARRIGDHGELGAEAPDEQALEAGLLRVAQRGLPGGQLAAGGVDLVDQVEQLHRAELDPAGEHVLGIERLPVVGAAALGHGVPGG